MKPPMHIFSSSKWQRPLSRSGLPTSFESSLVTVLGRSSGWPHLELQMCVNGIPPKPGEEAQGWRWFQPFMTSEGKKVSGISLLCILGAYMGRWQNIYKSKTRKPNNWNYQQMEGVTFRKGYFLTPFYAFPRASKHPICNKIKQKLKQESSN